MAKGNIHTESSTESTNTREDRPADAAQSAAPLEQKQTPSEQQSYIQTIEGKGPRDRSKEKAAASTDSEDRLLPYIDLSELGKFLVALSNKGAKLPENKGTKTLTVRQSETLATPLSFYLDSGEHIEISPDELYETDGLFKTWLEREVHPVLRQRAGHVKPISRKALLQAVTLGRRDLSLMAFYEWRETRQHLERLNAESYILQPDEDMPRHADDDRPLTVLPGVLSLEELLRDNEDEPERSANDDEQE